MKSRGNNSGNNSGNCYRGGVGAHRASDAWGKGLMVEEYNRISKAFEKLAGTVREVKTFKAVRSI